MNSKWQRLRSPSRCLYILLYDGIVIHLTTNPVDVSVLEKLDPDMPKHAGFQRLNPLEMAPVGFAEEIDLRHGETAIIVSDPDTFVFWVIGNDDVPAPNRGVDQTLVFPNEIVGVTDRILADIHPQNISLVG